jgi:hypothetical protein
MRMTSDDAYRYLKSKRATISPNFNFLGQLLEFEKQLLQDRWIVPNTSSNHSKAATPPIESLPGQHTLSALSPHHHLLHHHFNPQPLHSPTTEPLPTPSTELRLHPLAGASFHRTSTGSDQVSSACSSVSTPSTCSSTSHQPEAMDANICDGQCVGRPDDGDDCQPTSGHKRHCSLASGARKLTLNLPVPTDQLDSIGTIAFI